MLPVVRHKLRNPGCSSVGPRSSWPAACPPHLSLSVPLLTVQHTGRPYLPCLTFATSTFSPCPLCSLRSSNARLQSPSSDRHSSQGSCVASSSPLQLRPFSPHCSDCPSRNDETNLWCIALVVFFSTSFLFSMFPSDGLNSKNDMLQFFGLISVPLFKQIIPNLSMLDIVSVISE